MWYKSINQSINQEIDLQLQKVSKLQSKILVEKRVIKYLQINLENKRECFEKNKYVWKSEGNSRVARPKQGEFALNYFCEMVD